MADEDDEFEPTLEEDEAELEWQVREMVRDSIRIAAKMIADPDDFGRTEKQKMAEKLRGIYNDFYEVMNIPDHPVVKRT